MALPHFHTMPKVLKPIFLNSYEATFITTDDERFNCSVESFEISDNIITCKIQDHQKSSLSTMKKLKIMVIEHYSNGVTAFTGDIVRIDILGVKNINYKSSFDWNRHDELSVIEVSFDITYSKSMDGDNLSTTDRDSIIKSIIRDEKLNILLN